MPILHSFFDSSEEISQKISALKGSGKSWLISGRQGLRILFKILGGGGGVKILVRPIRE